jgi:microcystin-dependent protein
MATPFLSEIRIFAFNYAPKSWAMCNGQILAIAQNQALFSLLGTTFGGNGVQTFGLPNLQGRVPAHFGNGVGLSPRVMGETYGEEVHTLIIGEMPNHMHLAMANSTDATALSPAGNDWAKQPAYLPFAVAGGGAMLPTAIGMAGNSQPHNNLQPYLVLTFCIALVGIFPSRN